MLTVEMIWDHIQRLHGDNSVLIVDDLDASLRAAKYNFDRYATLIPALRKLSKAGLGEFRVGRRNKKSRVLWKGRPRDLRYVLPTSSGNGVAPLEIVEYPLPLRPGVTARFSLPTDLTKADATRICQFIQGLPIS